MGLLILRACAVCIVSTLIGILATGCSGTSGASPALDTPQSTRSVVAPDALAAATPAPTPLPVSAQAADSIVANIGVVTHFAYTTTAYKYLTASNPAPNGDSVISSLKTLGVRHLRDGSTGIAANSAICNAFKSAYANGADIDIVMASTDTATTFAATYACLGPALKGYEGPNELDNSGDKTWAADDVAAMSRLSAARGTSFPSTVVLAAPSMDLGCTSYEAEAAVSNDSISKYVDANNAHIYFGDYQPENDGTGNEQCNIGPYGSESTAIKSAEIPATTKPFVVTETGYTDDCCSLSDTGYVSPTVKTKYLLRSLLIHYHAGAAFSYVYELATEGQSYGLTDQYLNPKPAYTALENFIHIMQDPGGTRTGTLYAGKSSGLTNAVQLLFEKKDGSFWLIIWNPAESWNPATNTAINVAPLSGTLTFATKPSALKLYVFNPATGAVTATSYTPATTLNITVSDMPEILQIGTTTSPPVLATPQPPKT